MRLFLFIAGVCCFLPFVAAQDAAQVARAGPYTFAFLTEPAVLEPAASALVVTVTQGDAPLAQEELWVRLRNKEGVEFAGIFRTDDAGAVSVAYRFPAPGEYALDLEMHGERVSMPVHVHGQYILAFGFLAATFIVIALLVRAQ